MTTGHFFAFTLAAQLAPTADERAAAAETVAQMVDYMLESGYNLKDWHGYDTTVSANATPVHTGSFIPVLDCPDLI